MWFLVFKETVWQRRWESETKFGFIKRVDKGWITTVKDLENWRFDGSPFVGASRGIVECWFIWQRGGAMPSEEMCWHVVGTITKITMAHNWLGRISIVFFYIS